MKPLSLYQTCRRMRTSACDNRRQRLLTRILIAALLAVQLTPVTTAHAQETDGNVAPAAVDWIEPRGVNVVDLVGLVPEAHLRNAIVRYAYGIGIAFYESGSRSGNTVRVRLRYSSSPTSTVLCPGKPASFDEWPSVVPAGTMRVYSGNDEITDRVTNTFTYYAAGLRHPSSNTGASYRYPSTQASTDFQGNGSIRMPANMGCEYRLNGSFSNVTAEFVYETPAYINVTVLGSATGTFRSYIGPGSAGVLDSLRNQMRARYGDRHDDIPLNLPQGTEFILVKYPPTPVDPYSDPNKPGSGTYRIRRPNGRLSVDHFNTMALPFYGQYQDADQSGGAEYLPAFSDGVRLSSPEYFVPVGVSYNSCMTNGGCSAGLLESIYNAEMTLEVYYYRIDRVRGGLTQIPLRQVGPNWSTALSADAQSAEQADLRRDEDVTVPSNDHTIYLPTIMNTVPPPPDVRTGCPCGWFDDNGRMLDFVAP